MRFNFPVCLTFFALISACGSGGTSSVDLVTFAEIANTFDLVDELFDGDGLESDILNAEEISALGSASYSGLAGIGAGADDTGGLLGRLTMQVVFGDQPTVSGSADGFVVLDPAALGGTEDQFIANAMPASGSVSFSNGSIVTSDGISLLAFAVDGQVNVPNEAGLAIGSGALTIAGRTAAGVTEEALISDFSEVAGSLEGEDVVVGFSVYGFRD